MEELAESAEFAKRVPDFATALLASNLASEMLNSAREKYSKKTYDDTIIESRNAIRAAASAVLISDGYVASTFEATMKYLKRYYHTALPLDEWTEVEKNPVNENKGVMYVILKLLGRIKETDKKQAEKALMAAENFLTSARMIMEER